MDKVSKSLMSDNVQTRFTTLIKALKDDKIFISINKSINQGNLTSQLQLGPMKTAPVLNR